MLARRNEVANKARLEPLGGVEMILTLLTKMIAIHVRLSEVQVREPQGVCFNLEGTTLYKAL